jgi:hypothetical protein
MEHSHGSLAFLWTYVRQSSIIAHFVPRGEIAMEEVQQMDQQRVKLNWKF